MVETVNGAVTNRLYRSKSQPPLEDLELLLAVSPLPQFLVPFDDSAHRVAPIRFTLHIYPIQQATSAVLLGQRRNRVRGTPRAV